MFKEPPFSVNLKVLALPKGDVWKDTVRIPKAFRLDKKRNPAVRGKVYCIEVNGKSRWIAMHGLNSKQPIIQMDLNTRDGLGVKTGRTYAFTLKKVGWFRSLWFPWFASDPIYRLPAQLGLLSFVFGVILALIGVLFPLWWEHHKSAVHEPSTAIVAPKQ